MSNYEFKCSDCGKVIAQESTGEYTYGDVIECISCGRVLEVIDMRTHLYVKNTSLKNTPSKLDALDAKDGSK